MKRLLYLLFTVLFVISINILILSACAKKETVKESGEGNTPAAQQEVKAQPAPSGEEMKKAPAMEQTIMEDGKTALADIHFDFDKYNLRTQDRKTLSSHAEWLLKNKDYNVKIEGNCDERGTEEYNMALGQKRAGEAAKFLINEGINKKRISTISYGKDRPVDPGHNEEAWAKNRNDHFILLLPNR